MFIQKFNMVILEIIFFLNNFFITKFFKETKRTYLFNLDDKKNLILASPTKRQARAFNLIMKDKNNFFKAINLITEKEEGNICLDIGANLGYWSMAFNKYLRKEKVILAIEPDRRNLNYISYNLRNEKNISIFQVGLSSKIESKTFGIPAFQKLRPGEQGINTGNISLYHDNDNIFDKVRLTSVDKLIPAYTNDNDRVFLVKIDVEGHELEVIKGMKNNITKFRPVVILEINPNTQKLAKYDLRELFGIFNQYFMYVPKNIGFDLDDKGIPNHPINMILSSKIVASDVLSLMGYVNFSLNK